MLHTVHKITLLSVFIMGAMEALFGIQVSANDTHSPALLSSEIAVVNSKITPEIKVAVLGDTDSGTNFGDVLQLTAAEKASVVMINGDFGYNSTPTAWKDRVIKSINVDNFPIIGALGNHDLGANTNTYVGIFDGFRNKKNGLKSKCTGTPGISTGHDITIADEICTFGNVSIVASGIGQVLNEKYFEGRLEEKLKSAPANNWKLIGYHYTLSNMNPGIKGDENTFSFFEIIRKYGAIGAQAHTHSVMASCPIVSPFKKGAPILCHPDFGADLLQRFIAPGVGMYVDSSLGGKEVRSRGRCRNPTETGCLHMVDLITQEGYTRIDGITKTKFNSMGALFFVFNTGGDPSKARVYYKSIDGQEIFNFNISR